MSEPKRPRSRSRVQSSDGAERSAWSEEPSTRFDDVDFDPAAPRHAGDAGTADDDEDAAAAAFDRDARPRFERLRERFARDDAPRRGAAERSSARSSSRRAREAELLGSVGRGRRRGEPVGPADEAGVAAARSSGFRRSGAFSGEDARRGAGEGAAARSALDPLSPDGEGEGSFVGDFARAAGRGDASAPQFDDSDAYRASLARPRLRGAASAAEAQDDVDGLNLGQTEDELTERGRMSLRRRRRYAGRDQRDGVETPDYEPGPARDPIDDVASEGARDDGLRRAVDEAARRREARGGGRDAEPVEPRSRSGRRFEDDEASSRRLRRSGDRAARFSGAQALESRGGAARRARDEGEDRRSLDGRRSTQDRYVEARGHSRAERRHEEDEFGDAHHDPEAARRPRGARFGPDGRGAGEGRYDDDDRFAREDRFARGERFVDDDGYEDDPRRAEDPRFFDDPRDVDPGSGGAGDYDEDPGRASERPQRAAPFDDRSPSTPRRRGGRGVDARDADAAASARRRGGGPSQRDAAVGSQPGGARSARFDDDEIDAVDADGAEAPTSRRARRAAEEPAPAISSGDLGFRQVGAFSRIERLLAGRYLRARRKEGFISVIAALSLIGITLGVATLIIVMSVMNGFRAELVEKIIGVNGHMSVTSPSGGGIEGYDAAAAALRTIPGVTDAVPMISSQVFVTGRSRGVGAVVRGVRREDVMSIDGVGRAAPGSENSLYPIGSLSEFGGEAGVAIGSGLARSLGVSVGDTISILTPNGRATPFGVVPRRKAYRVLQVFQVGLFNFDSAVLFMPLEEAQRFFGRITQEGAPYVDQIEVTVATPERLNGYRADIVEQLGTEVRIRDWRSANGSFVAALQTEQTVMFLILSLLILIASLIIISGMIMLVKEKGPDIAILRTMGLTRSAILRVFFMCGAAIGVVGTVLGVALGVAITLNLQAIKAFVEYVTGREVFPSDIYYLSELPARLEMSDMLMTVGIALSLSFIATIYPAWRAARLDPVEALRYE